MTALALLALHSVLVLVLVSEVIVVVHRVTERKEEQNTVNKRLRAVGGDVLGEVLLSKALRGNLGRSTGRKALVEVDDASHLLGIGVTAQVRRRSNLRGDERGKTSLRNERHPFEESLVFGQNSQPQIHNWTISGRRLMTRDKLCDTANSKFRNTHL